MTQSSHCDVKRVLLSFTASARIDWALLSASMTPQAPPDDALQRARAEIERLRAENAQLNALLAKTPGWVSLSDWEHAQLQLALALSDIGLWRHDLGSGLVLHNARAQAIVGRSDAAHGVPLDAVRSWMHPDDLADAQAALETTLAGGGPVDTQTRFRHSDGRWRTVLMRRLLMRDDHGAPAMILGVALDVTEQQQRTTEALQLARRLDAAAEAA
jgi:PAS domain S-box-containing protein